MSEIKNRIITDLITKHIDVTNKKHFDLLMQDVENYIEGGTAHNMLQLKEMANNKRKKGIYLSAFVIYIYKRFSNTMKYGSIKISQKN